MGSTNAMLTQIIQDAILKLCTQNIIFHKSLEIDGIICISHSEEDKDMVIKMHRTIVKPENSNTHWNDSSLHNIHVQNTPLVYAKSPRITENVQHYEPPKVNLIPIATAEIPGGQVANAAKLTIKGNVVNDIKEETSEKTQLKKSSKDNKRPISESSTTHSPNKQPRLDDDPQSSPNAPPPLAEDSIVNVKREVEEEITLDYDNGAVDGAEEGQDEPSWLDSTPLKISPSGAASSTVQAAKTIKPGEALPSWYWMQGEVSSIADSLTQDPASLSNRRQQSETSSYEHHLSSTQTFNDPIISFNESMNKTSTSTKQVKEKKKVSCHICLKQFGKNQHLGYHMNIHTGERPFVCDICKESFGHPYKLSKHKAKFHPQPDL
ncbi:unnamed protein product [Owenia fusiformis]|uniref:C2H2-type domain-containing protein n=1 Tax=Owenia fusiformis TaxID=6347 RepID=A0A8S4N8U9_OWEFU|nr:unnamed protein product [Owenia fusiformis]